MNMNDIYEYLQYDHNHFLTPLTKAKILGRWTNKNHSLIQSTSNLLSVLIWCIWWKAQTSGQLHRYMTGSKGWN